MNATRHGLLLWLTPAITATLALALLLAAYLDGYKFERALLDLTQSRAGFILRTLERTAESNLRLGLPLESLDHIRGTLNREAAADPELLSISVYDTRGRAVLSTNRTHEGRRAPERWRDALPGGKDRVWRREVPHTLVLGMPLQDALGETAGTIVLRYDLAHIQAIAGTLNRTLLVGALVLAAVFTVPVAVAAYMLLRPVSRGANAMADELEAAASADDPATVPPARVPDGAPLANSYPGFRRAVLNALAPTGGAGPTSPHPRTGGAGAP